MSYYIKKKPKEKGRRNPSLRSLVEKLDRVFSLYIRLRDSRAFGYRAFRCISCGAVKPFDKADCGHYYSRAKMSVRFDEDNCHAECSSCNRFKADHLIGYRENLIRKIGQKRFDILRLRSNGVRKWSAWELEELCKHYTALNEKMEKER